MHPHHTHTHATHLRILYFSSNLLGTVMNLYSKQIIYYAYVLLLK